MTNQEDKIDKILRIVEATDKKLDTLAIKVKKLEIKDEQREVEIQEIQEENKQLRKKIENLEQYSRRSNLIISGVPLKKEEKIKEIIKKLAEKWDIDLHDYDIMAAHRLRTKTNIPDIIVKVNNRDLIGQFIQKSKRKQITSENINLDVALPIYCSEHLTPYNKSLLYWAKKLKREGLVKFVWVKDGVVMVREREETPAKRIEGERDLDEWWPSSSTVGVETQMEVDGEKRGKETGKRSPREWGKRGNGGVEVYGKEGLIEMHGWNPKNMERKGKDKDNDKVYSETNPKHTEITKNVWQQQRGNQNHKSNK